MSNAAVLFSYQLDINDSLQTIEELGGNTLDALIGYRGEQLWDDDGNKILAAWATKELADHLNDEIYELRMARTMEHEYMYLNAER